MIEARCSQERCEPTNSGKEKDKTPESIDKTNEEELNMLNSLLIPACIGCATIVILLSLSLIGLDAIGLAIIIAIVYGSIPEMEEEAKISDETGNNCALSGSFLEDIMCVKSLVALQMSHDNCLDCESSYTFFNTYR